MSGDRARRHAEQAEQLAGDGDAATHASLAVYYAAEETNELLRQLLVGLSAVPQVPTPGRPARPPEPDPPSPWRPGPPPRPGLPPEM